MLCCSARVEARDTQLSDHRSIHLSIHLYIWKVQNTEQLSDEVFSARVAVTQARYAYA